MIDFSEYTEQNILEDMLTQVDDSFDTREGSVIGSALGPTAWYLEGVYLDLENIQRNAYAGTAVGEFLDYITEERNIHRKAATPAVRKGMFNVSIPEGSRFSTINGDNSIIFSVGKLLEESEGVFVYQLTCETSGIQGNAYSGILMPVTAIEGLDMASIGEIITPGADEEEDDALRLRYEASFETTNFGGNISSYRNRILARSDVSAVQVYPAWKGGGTVLCSVLGNHFEPATQGVVDAVQEDICPLEDGQEAPSPQGFGFAPIGASVTITTAQAVDINIQATVERDMSSMTPSLEWQEQIEANVRAYIDSVNAGWGKAIKSYMIEYPMVFYVSRFIVAISSVPGVINVTDVKINGSGKDLRLTETAQIQQIGRLGKVELL